MFYLLVYSSPFNSINLCFHAPKCTLQYATNGIEVRIRVCARSAMMGFNFIQIRACTSPHTQAKHNPPPRNSHPNINM